MLLQSSLGCFVIALLLVKVSGEKKYADQRDETSHKLSSNSDGTLLIVWNQHCFSEEMIPKVFHADMEKRNSNALIYLMLCTWDGATLAVHRDWG